MARRHPVASGFEHPRFDLDGKRQPDRIGVRRGDAGAAQLARPAGSADPLRAVRVSSAASVTRMLPRGSG
jgi:hypothetical protein